MTAPDVAALAAALEPFDVIGYAADPHGTTVYGHEAAQAIIAALAAQGWRLTANEPLEDAKLAASAQAVPSTECPCCGNYWPDAMGPAFERATRNIEQAAVRAALEGLRAEVAAYHGGSPDRNDAVDDALSGIDARLAALDG